MSMDRPARKQVLAPVKATVSADQAGTYNIWYNRWTGEGRRRAALEKAETRCRLSRDMGYTKATTGSAFCIHFARGCCMKGHQCTYWHRIPLPTDRETQAHDIFGRERFREDRDDMGGVGSFERDNRTLYVGNMKTPQSSMEEVAKKQFSEWGEIEHINILPHKSVAFVRYVHRANAEFAREAMYGQSLESNEILNVRWATEDPNPRVKDFKKRKAEEHIAEALQEKLPVIGDMGNVLDYEDYYNTDVQQPPQKAQRLEPESDLAASLRDASEAVYENDQTSQNGWTWDGTQWQYTGSVDDVANHQAAWQAYYQQQAEAAQALEQGTYDEETYKTWFAAQNGQSETENAQNGQAETEKPTDADYESDNSPETAAVEAVAVKVTVVDAAAGGSADASESEAEEGDD